MILIADSGSTNTNWALCDEKKKSIVKFVGQGINPRFMDAETIKSIIIKDFTKYDANNISKVFFYGAGCGANDSKIILYEVLKNIFFNAAIIEIYTDIYGAARGLWGKEKGLVAILGTGANSCFYDGNNCITIKPSLGYLFGDEGSGAYIGKELIKLYLKNKLPVSLSKKFYNKYKLSTNDILNNVYGNVSPNQYLAGFTTFLNENINDKFIYHLLEKAFKLFVSEYLQKYKTFNHYNLKITGSVAFYFKDILSKIISNNGFFIKDILQNPLDGLIQYHFNYLEN